MAWIGLPHYTPSDPTFRQKMSWWRLGYDVRTEPWPKLKVTGQRLDVSSHVLVSDQASSVAASPPDMITGVNFPSTGCWQITGNYQGSEVTFVLWVGT